MYILSQLAVLTLSSVLLTSLFNKRLPSFLVAVLSGVLIALEVSSVVLGGSLIDYRFIIHFNLADIWAFKLFFFKEAFIIAAALCASPFLLYYAGRQWHSRVGRLRYTVTLILISVSVMSLREGVLRNLYDLTRLIATPARTFTASLNQLGISRNTFTLPSDIKARPGKNIIVISLESFELGFLSDSLAHLTPHLRALAREMTLFEMLPTPGSDWTAGSIYTELTGVPAFFKGHGNQIFQGTTNVTIPGVGHILRSAGYDITYLLGKDDFAGLGPMLKAYRFVVKSDHDFAEHYPLSFWGLHDKDLFQEAKRQIASVRNTGKPFAVFMSTVSTHHPNGIYDPRMQPLIARQKTDLEFMVAAVDYMVGDLVEWLAKEGLLSNTSIYLFPDHLFMGTTARVLRAFPAPRRLYVITNAKKSTLSYNTTEPLYQIDIPKLILEGAGVTHNVTFLTDLLPAGDKIDFIRRNQRNIMALNEASIRREDFTQGMTLEWSDGKALTIASGTYVETIGGAGGVGTAYEFFFDDRMRLLSRRAVKDNGVSPGQFNQPTLFVSVRNGVLVAYLQKGSAIGMMRQGQRRVRFSQDDMKLFADMVMASDPSKRPKGEAPISPYGAGWIYLASSGRNKNMKTEIRMGNSGLSTSRGVNIVTGLNGEYKVQSVDTYGDAVATRRFIRTLDELRRRHEFYALVVQDNAAKELKPYSDQLTAMGFGVLAAVGEGDAYVAYSYKGIVSEHRSANGLAFIVPREIPIGARSVDRIHEDAADRSRFIAHAGGKIDGRTYTNSLEALDMSYKKGFRIFELDISKTADGQYVATHDWKQWVDRNKYTGRVPPTAADFMRYKESGRFTPLDMTMINRWFQAHKNAILVTDKINEPKEFATRFIDRKRLMMELFSMDAVKEGIAAGIRSAMPSAVVVNQIPGDKVSVLKKLKVTHVAVPRGMIRSNLRLFKELKDNDIKVYVFQVNVDEGKDEAYVVLNDMDYVYGLYADEWTFTDAYRAGR